MDPKAFQAQIMALSNATALLQAAKTTILKADVFLTQLPATQENAQQAGTALKQGLIQLAQLTKLGGVGHIVTIVLQLVIIGLLTYVTYQTRKLARASKEQ